LKTHVTETLLKSIKPSNKQYWIYDTDLTGFAILIRPSGVWSFCIQYRNLEQRKKTYTIGKYGNLTVKQARDTAKKLLGQVANYIDIHEEKKARRVNAKKKRQRTLRTFVDERYKPYVMSEMKRGKDRMYLLNHYFVEDWGEKPLDEINNWLVTGWRKKQLERGLSHSGVNRPISALKAMMNKAVIWDVIENNPLASMKLLKEDSSPVIRYLQDPRSHRSATTTA
tara:strand:+ start:195 stop:869 length:675 start_codon:yes stop_codon:yes gene_type:complete